MNLQTLQNHLARKLLSHKLQSKLNSLCPILEGFVGFLCYLCVRQEFRLHLLQSNEWAELTSSYR